ncbi:CHAT domain-containing protein [Thelonectria olida]|uniref:CHAT domain-containing protein n=1 Tax=Thelonectria olida TaxID=1576542 RepID=A0A9P8VQU6_9HYPO|nr:CHAT domain-containing protein [Thelonectria olida]
MPRCIPPEQSSTRLSGRSAWVGIDDAIRLYRANLDAIPEDHPDRVACLDDLRIKLNIKAWKTGELADIEEAIEVGRAIIDSTPEGHPLRAECLGGLSEHFDTKARDITHLVVDYEESVQFARLAVEATPKDDPDQRISLRNLAKKLLQKYERTNAMVDLEEGIHIRREVLGEASEHHLNRLHDVPDLIDALCLRYERTKSVADLDEALSLNKEVSNEVVNERTCRKHFHSLGYLLLEKYEASEDEAYLREAIYHLREVVNATNQVDADRRIYLHSLSRAMRQRFQRSRAIPDLDEAIRLEKAAVNSIDNQILLAPTDFPTLDKTIQFENTTGASDSNAKPRNYRASLGTLLHWRHRLTGASNDLQEALSCFQAVMRQSHESIQARIGASRSILEISAGTSDWTQAYGALHVGINLIPQLMLRSQQVPDKQHLLNSWLMVGFASEAAAVSLQVGKGPLDALDLLEKGRGVLATSLMDLRTDLSELRKTCPHLAEQFIRFRNELQQLETHEHLRHDYQNHATRSLPYQHFEASNEIDRLIIEIRNQPGFEDFLTSPSETSIRAAAVYGPIVIINTTKYRCDAILVEQHKLHHISLPKLDMADLNKKAEGANLGSPDILEWLWDVVSQPVLHALGFTETPSGVDWPRIWWIPTGPLCKFPLHAAGYHRKGSDETVLDRVMSSYSSSIMAIIRGRRRNPPGNGSPGSSSALLVAMQETPGTCLSTLPFAQKEITMLHTLLKSMTFSLVEPGQRKDDIVPYLPSCQIFHFASHGYTHDDPLMSYLLLGDKTREPLTVNDLLEMNISENSPFLAYLSACGTCQVTSEKFLDESIHLVSACQLAGFRHVVGTLWEVNDELCVDAARLTYTGMRGGGMTDESVCRGLHNALRELRNRWLRASEEAADRKLRKTEKAPATGEEMPFELPRHVILYDEEDDREGRALQWVPYVHFGV